MKVVFKVKWKDGTPRLPELPEGMEILGVSAMEHVTGSGYIDAQITADEDVMNEIIENCRNIVSFVRYVEEIEIEEIWDK